LQKVPFDILSLCSRAAALVFFAVSIAASGDVIVVDERIRWVNAALAALAAFVIQFVANQRSFSRIEKNSVLPSSVVNNTYRFRSGLSDLPTR
jgi:uncharacterized membrane protein